MNDESTLRDAGCFFFGLVEKNFGLVANIVVKRTAQECRYKCRFEIWIYAHNQKKKTIYIAYNQNK